MLFRSGTQGPIVIELKYREAPDKPVITYHLEINEGAKGPFVAEEWLAWKRKPYGAPFRFLNFHEGAGGVVSGEAPDEQDERIEEHLSSPETIAVNYDPDPPQLIGIKEPENYLYPRLLPHLAEECRQATVRTQLFVSSHSPCFVNALKAEEVWVLYRDERGYTQARRAADMRGIPEFMHEGALLGDLWLEGHFEVGDPLVHAGEPKPVFPGVSPGPP